MKGREAEGAKQERVGPEAAEVNRQKSLAAGLRLKRQIGIREDL